MKEMKETKIVVKHKMPAKAKSGQLLRSHIEYDSEGNGAQVMHEHEPEPGKKSEPWSTGPSMHKKSFGSRMEAMHHMAQMAGINTSMEEEATEARAHGKGDSSDGKAGPQESEGDPDEDEAESWGSDPDPKAQAAITKAAKPKRNV